MADFFELVGWAPAGAEDLHLPMAASVLKAVQRDPTFRLLDCFRLGDIAEAVVADVTCSDIPHRNVVGIRPRERIAIIAVAGNRFVPAVQMLRKGFPHVMHVNGSGANSPRELCLYFEPPRAVLRSWTAPQFLRRIQWWLVSTANGTLHLADQPLELPFFDSDWELLLPPDIETLRTNPQQRYRLERAGPARRDDAMTLRVTPAAQKAGDTWGVAFFCCDPLVHGITINVPETLGGLARELAARGVDFVAQLRAQLMNDLADGGEKLAGAGDRFVLVVELPILRQAGNAVERIQRVAFLLLVGKLELGLRIGAYFKHDGAAYRFQALGEQAPQEGDWKTLTIMPAAVMDAADSARLRSYSGIGHAGPVAGTLVGAGALGSALADMWSRSGWGSWTVVDHDHIKPHNLARHRAFEVQIGESKASVAQTLSEAVSPRGVVKKALTCDACETSNEDLNKALDSSEFVLDCSTTLDFPRLASLRPSTARHASAFITPSGRDAVILMEDAKRTCRLNSLEAQYYRALINKPWGAGHLDSKQATFWSGASCRDISAKLEYAAVLGHAATINPQLRGLLDSPAAAIRVWIRNESTGAVQAIFVPVCQSIERVMEGIRMRFDEGFVRRLRAMREQFLPKETGGIVVGYFDLNLRELVLVDCFPAPPDSVHSTSHFIRGVKGVEAAVIQAHKRTAGVVHYVGEWHSHPPGHSAMPSRDDFIQLHRLSDVMAQDGVPVLQVIVGEGEISFQMFGEVLR